MSKSLITKKIILGLLLLILVSPSAHAQLDAVTGTLLGGAAGAANPKAVEAVTNTATAIGSGFMGILGKAISFVAVWMAYFIGYIAGIIFTFAGLFLSFGLKLNGSLLQSPTVNIGWSITRDLANLGFVLAIIFIAIATILRSQKYGRKKILGRLIAVAILINFSLTFAGILIDASGLMTNFFMAKVVPPSSGTSFSNMNSTSMAFASTLANAFGIQKALDTTRIDSKKIEGVSEFGASTFTLIANVVFVALFTIMGAVLMLTIAVLVFVRYVVLMILLILMPLAWLGWIFEGSAFFEAFTKWWKTFIDWLIWLPSAMFFIYLTILIVVNQSQDPNSVTQIAKSIQTAPQGNVLDRFLGFTGGAGGTGGIFETFGQMTAILFIMSGGLFMAKRISDHGAKTVIGFAERTQGYLTGKVRNATQKTLGYGTGYYAGKAAGGYVGGRLFDRYMRKEDSTGQTVGQKLSTNLARVGLGGAASTLSNYLAKNKEDFKKEVQDFQKQNLSNLKDDTLKAYPSQFKDPKILAAIGAEMAKRNILPTDRNELKPYIKAAKDTGVYKEILNTNPDLAEEFGKEIQEVVNKLEDIKNISKESLKKMDVQAALPVNKIKQLQGATEEKIDAFKTSLKENFLKLTQEIKTNPNRLPATEITKLQEKADKIYHRLGLVNTPSWNVKEYKQELKEEYKDVMTDRGMGDKQAEKEAKKLVGQQFKDLQDKKII